MLIDVVLEGKAALVVGGGREPEFKLAKLLDAGARTTVIAEEFTPGIRRMASRKGKIRLVKGEPSPAKMVQAMKEARPKVVFISTGDPKADEELAAAARSAGGAMVCVVDDPRLNDFNMPAVAARGDIRVGVSTGGRSPAMASVLRKRIEKSISDEDALQVKLQGEIRRSWKKWLKEPGERKEFAYRLISDRRIARCLRKKDYAGAKRLAQRMLREASASG
ncbi:MAG TPA: bifunctional precorrin-2 dehydrogenase/sirohydrochlorin ferrochelatase [Nitrososphaerales archaeon]|nr:bifunctional precorrin-2 dehydrogenase/sirohydrochlorin ferrochelatase [Nitrososphaerales archaeon]HUK74587.1 bifunctional precorrin-2 dehydrogenase/sirohydrochlorin ferrochelatase [Nitrososphaerales archaeon]